jgi:hypothetical protein
MEIILACLRQLIIENADYESEIERLTDENDELCETRDRLVADLATLAMPAKA